MPTVLKAAADSTQESVLVLLSHSKEMVDAVSVVEHPTPMLPFPLVSHNLPLQLPRQRPRQWQRLLLQRAQAQLVLELVLESNSSLDLARRMRIVRMVA